MKETKIRTANGTNEGEVQISGEDKTLSPEKKGDNSFCPSNDTGHGVSADVKEKIVLSSSPAVVWAGQNGHGKQENTDFMELQEAFTIYNGVNGIEKSHEDPSAETKGDNYSRQPMDVVENGEDPEKTEINGKVEIVIIGEDETDMNKNVSRQENCEDQKALEETIPLGTEAQSYEKTSRLENLSQLEVPVDKRLKWLLGNLDQNSFGSDLSQNTATSNSSDISVDMLLQERSDDPEEILISLGFGDVEDIDNPIERIPERFIVDKSGADGVSITDVLSDNPELSQFLQVISDQQEGKDNSANIDAMMAGHGNPNYGNMLNSVMHGMKFLNLLSSAKSLSNLSDKTDEHPSVLQNPKNREYLAKQGFYDRHSKEKANQNSKSNKLVKSQSLDASEKRKRFHATKSRNYSSLTNVPEQEEMFDQQRAGNGNYQSFGTSFGTGRGSSFDYYGRSLTSMETSTDSYDSNESPVYGGHHGKQEPYSDSGIWNTEDSQKSIDEEYLAEFASDSAKERRSQVNRMMSADHYNVGDDADILKNPPLSRTGSLESTLTSNGLRRLEAKSSTLKGNDSFDDDVEFYSEGYFLDQNLEERANKYQHTLDELDKGKNNKSSENISKENAIQPERARKVESVSKWKRLQKNYGVEISVQLPETKIASDVVNNNYETSRNAEYKIPLEKQTEKSTDTPDRLGLGSIGKIESVQSDSSGFAEAEPTSMPEPQVVQKVSSLGSSTESDQTFKSSITILPAKSDTPKMSITSPDGTQSISLDISGSEDVGDRSHVDVAIGTDDFSEYLHTPTVSYHLHERDHGDSGTCSESEKSVILTIELPKNWVNTNPNKKIGKPRVVSHLYKEIGPRSLSVDLDSQEHVSQGSAFGVYKHKNNSNYPLTRAVSDGSVPIDIPPRSSTPYKYHQTSLKSSMSPSNQTFYSSQYNPHCLSPSSLSAFSDYSPSRKYPDSESEYSASNTSLLSDSITNLCNNSLEYYKLMKLVNQPMSFKTDSGEKNVVRFEPKFSIKKWTQLKRQQQLEEETKLVQHTLQKYKAEINMMESHFLVKTQLVKDDLSFGDREDVQELQLLWAEVRKEVLLMEQTLANRLNGITMGNDSYNPLLALDIVGKMTELLREQIYQQQITFDQEEVDKSTDTLWTNGSKEVLDRQRSMSESDHSFTSSLSELKETILSEVRQELHDSTQWLHRELQKKERELNALKMEMMAANIKTGTTRKKHFFESDV